MTQFENPCNQFGFSCRLGTQTGFCFYACNWKQWPVWASFYVIQELIWLINCNSELVILILCLQLENLAVWLLASNSDTQICCKLCLCFLKLNIFSLCLWFRHLNQFVCHYLCMMYIEIVPVLLKFYPAIFASKYVFLFFKYLTMLIYSDITVVHCVLHLVLLCQLSAHPLTFSHN